MTTAPPLIVIAGATATGKTALAIDLAERLIADGRTAEVISADSRQVFRGLDIGTAKATAAERARVPHHGLDLVDPDEPFSLADFVSHADAVLDDLGRRRGIAILAGGTGLYLRAVARGIDTAALPSDVAVRAGIEQDLLDLGLPTVARRLETLAPRLASTVDLRNPRRVVRALEIAELVGDVPRPPARGYPGEVVWLGLRIEPEAHRDRIAIRARAQFDGGLVEEADALRRRFDPGLPAFTAIGYTEAWGLLDGTMTPDAAIEADIARNMAFASRQRTWFRAEPDIEWIDATDGVHPRSILERVSVVRCIAS